MMRFTKEGKVYVCLTEGLIQGWVEVSSLAELCSYQDKLDNAPSELLGPKWMGAPVPAEITGDVLALIKHYNSFEIIVALFYNPETQDWVARIPEQRGTGAHVSYTESEDLDIPEGYYFTGTIHSHPNMGAFWSSTDRADQGGKSGIHLVVGTDREGNRKTYVSSVFYLKKDYPDDDAFLFPDTLPEVREDWVSRIEAMRRVREFTAPASTYSFRPASSWNTGYTGGRYSTRYPAGSSFGMYADDIPEYYCGGSAAHTSRFPELEATYIEPEAETLSDLIENDSIEYCENCQHLRLLYDMLERRTDPRAGHPLLDYLESCFQTWRYTTEPIIPVELEQQISMLLASALCPDKQAEIESLYEDWTMTYGAETYELENTIEDNTREKTDV